MPSKIHRNRLFGRGPRIHQRERADGKPVITVSAHAPTANQARLADWSAKISTVIFLALCLYGALIAPDPSLRAWIVAIVLPMAAYFPLLLAFRFVLVRSILVVFTPETVMVRRLLGWKRFDRHRPHTFTLRPHDRTDEETAAHDLAQRKAQLKGKAIGKKRYYGQSFHLSYEELGLRTDLMAIHGRTLALDIQAALTAADEVMDGLARDGNGVALNADDDWSRQPGGLPGVSSD